MENAIKTGFGGCRRQSITLFPACEKRRCWGQRRFSEKVFLLLMGCSKNYIVLGFTVIIIPSVPSLVCTNITIAQSAFCAF